MSSTAPDEWLARIGQVLANRAERSAAWPARLPLLAEVPEPVHM